MAVRNAGDDGELSSAISASSGGDEIVLTGPSYTVGSINNAYGSQVRIYGQNSSSPPTWSGRLHLNGAQNIRFDDIIFDRPYVNGNGNQVNTIEIDTAANLAFYDCEVQGGVRTSDGANNGRGINASSCNGLDFVRVKFSKLFKGYTGNADNHLLSYCEFTDIRSDGLTLGGADDIIVEYCYFHDFQTLAGSGAHPDMLQVQRTSGFGTNRLTVRNNVFDIGTGNFCQGFFSGDSGRTNTGTGTVVRHTDWVVHDNLVMVDHANDMVFTWVDGLQIYNNATIRIEANNNSGTQSSIDCLDCTSTTIDRNIAGGWSTGGGITATNNSQVLISDWPTEFNTIAATSLTDPAFDDSYHDFEIKAGSTTHTLQAGPRLMKREGGWGGNGFAPNPNYPGGFGGVVTPTTARLIQMGGNPLIMGGSMVRMG